MVEGPLKVLIEDDRRTARFAEAAIGKADAPSFDELRWRGLMRVSSHHKLRVSRVSGVKHITAME
jgi:hypothetical protein